MRDLQAECAEVCTSSCHADDCEHHGHLPAPSTPPEPGLSEAWAELMAEARAFEAWYGESRLSVNAWVGVDSTSGGLYGGWAVEGDHLYDEWDESEMMTASGDTPEAVIADLIRIARGYRERRDAERAEDEAAARLEGGTE